MAVSESVIMGHDGSTDRKVRTDTGGFLDLTDSIFRVRGSLKTGYVSISNGTEATLLAGTSDKYHDLLQISLSNTSAGVIDATLKDDGTTVQIFTLAANQTYNFNFQKPIPSNDKNRAWTVDLPDDNNSSVTVQALFVEL